MEPVGGRRWRTRFAEDVLPFLSSLGVHAVVVAMAVLAARYVLTAAVVTQPERWDQMVVGEGIVKQDSDGPAGMGPEPDVFRKALQDQYLQAPDVGGIDPEPGGLQRVGEDVGGGDRWPGPGLLPADPAMDDLLRCGGSAVGSGVSKNNGAGGDGGPLAFFGTPQTGGGSKLFGTYPYCLCTSAGRRLSLVCDASASMINKMAALKNELGRAVGGMKVVNEFNVVFFRGPGYTAFSNLRQSRRIEEGP